MIEPFDIYNMPFRANKFSHSGEIYEVSYNYLSSRPELVDVTDFLEDIFDKSITYPSFIPVKKSGYHVI